MMKGESVSSYLTKLKKKDKKKKSQTAASTDIDDFSSKFDENFSLIACLSSSKAQRPQGCGILIVVHHII
jgi:hypothetical protein